MIISRRSDYNLLFQRDLCGAYTASFKHWQLTSKFQAIFDSSGSLIGYEALLRIHDENGNNTITPDQFFHGDHLTCEEKVNVDRIARAIHIRNFARSDQAHLKLFLNMLPISSEHGLMADKNAQLLKKRLNELALSNDQLVMEIVEQKAGDELMLAKAAQNMRENGFSLAVDDYGSEASDMNRIRLLKPDIIKLDRELMLEYMSGCKARLEQIVAVAKKSGALTVVEGIELPAQLKAMKQLGIDFFQGFYLARPKKLTAALAV